MKRLLMTTVMTVIPTMALTGCGPNDSAGIPAAIATPSAIAAALGSVTARPEADDADTAFEIRTAALGRSYFGYHILLSDLPDEPVGSSGKWARLSSDLEAPYHRLAITLSELPSAPGEVAATRLEYSLHDAAAGPFNYGWTALEGTVVVAEIDGITEVKEGIVPGASLAGHFELTNNRGGRFAGRFTILP